MNTKPIHTLIVVALLTSSSCLGAQPELFPTKPWTAILKIVNESGEPVAGASVEAGYITMPTSIGERWSFGSRGGKIEGLTDTNGMFAATHTDRSPSLGFQVQKAGYYKTSASLNIGFPEQNANNRNIAMNLVLRKVGNPIPMYAKKQELKFPKPDEPIGFDLMAGDWVTPYGKGLHTDMFFKAHREIKSSREFSADLTVSFPNKGDGIAIAPHMPDTGSEFKTSRTASENGYEPELDLHYSNTNQPPSVFGYFVRVHTELNPDGTVKSALYGKIAGNFKFYAGTIKPTSGMEFTYYLNPTPNDRNLEWDTKRDLFGDLPFMDTPREP